MLKNKNCGIRPHIKLKKITAIVSFVFHENFVVPSLYQNFFFPLLSLSLPLVKICAKISSSHNYHSPNSPSRSHIEIGSRLSLSLAHRMSSITCRRLHADVWSSSLCIIVTFSLSIPHFSCFFMGFLWLGYVYSVSRLYFEDSWI